MKKLLINTLLCTFLYVLSSLTTLADTTESSFIPVTRFKTKLIPPCGCYKTPSTTCTKGYFYCQSDLLQKAIKYAFCTDDLNEAMTKMNCSCNFYYAQNNTTIKNGTYDVYKLFSLKELCNSNKVKITITLASDCYGEVDKKPELMFGLYKNINQCELNKKFKSRAFLHHYLMKKYEIPLNRIYKKYNDGIQKLVAVVDLNQIDYENAPLYAVVTYIRGGFKYMKDNRESKCKNYAYLIEIEKLP